MTTRTTPQDWAKLRRPDHLFGAAVLHAAYARRGFARHWHDEFAFGVIESGVNTFWCRGHDHQGPAGMVTLMNPGEVHDGRVGEHGWRQRMFYVAPHVVADALSDLRGQTSDMPFFTTPVIVDPPLADLIRRAHRACFQEDALSGQSAILWAMAQLAVRHADTRPMPQRLGPEPIRVRRMRDYIHDHMDESLTLSDLAETAGVGRFQAIRLFRAAMGLPPHAYLVQCRVQSAARLLRSGTSPAEAATAVGFADQSHLTRHFKRTFGVTPGVFSAA